MLSFAVTIIIAAALLIPLSTVTYAASGSKYDLDVIFVIDNSGSMSVSDPERLATSAANKFIDLCKGSDTRVGYVLFKDEIVESWPLTDIANYGESTKQKLAKTKQTNTGETDTALGLEEAFKMLQNDSLGGKSRRTPIVILLSDGNTYLPDAKYRTTDEALKALDKITLSYAAEGVPIYTIGFNYDGSMDVDAMEKIAHTSSPDAIFREIESADRLIPVMTEIFQKATSNSGGTVRPLPPFTGEPQEEIISVSNNSIIKATVTITSDNPITDVSIRDPHGTVFDNSNKSNNVSITKDPNDEWVMVIMIKPEKGEWILTFTGVEYDIGYLEYLSFYDMTLYMDKPTTAIGEATISWHVEDEYNNRIDDKALIDAQTVRLHANDGTKEIVLDFPRGQMNETFEIDPGDYEAYLVMTGDDGGVSKSNTESFTVPSIPPCTLWSPSADTKVIKLMTIFSPSQTFLLSDMIKYTSANEPLIVKIKSGNWEDIVDVDYNKKGTEFAVKALKSGDAIVEVSVEGEGSNGIPVTFYLDVKIASGLIYIIIGAAVLLLVLVLVILLLRSKKPHLDDPMRDIAIEVTSLPDQLNYPQAGQLRLEHAKGKRSLRQIIDYNREYRDEYNAAFYYIPWFLNGTELFAKRKTQLDITIPVDNTYIVNVDGQRLMRPYVGCLRNDRDYREMKITIIQDDYNVYEIVLGRRGSQDGGGDWGGGDWGGGDPYSTGYGQGGYGNYGGSSDTDFDLV